MQLILLVLGIAGLVIPEQFSGQDTLAVALIIIFGVITLIQILWFLFVASKIKKTHDSFFDRRGGLF